MDVSFLKDNKKHLWYKKVFDSMLASLDEFKNNNCEEAREDCFKKMLLEFCQYRNGFIKDIKDLPLIMKCRVKNDNDKYFGGHQCGKFMDGIIHSCKIYLSTSSYLENSNFGHVNQDDYNKYSSIRKLNMNINEESSENEGESLSDAVKTIKDKAVSDRNFAKNFEYETKKVYLSTGQDNTLDILKNSGYNF